MFINENQFLDCLYNGIEGVMCIDTGKPGPNIGLIGLTHGNEPVGLQVFQYYYNAHQNKNIVFQSGKIYLIANNIMAYKANKRFLDHNMNRIGNYIQEKKSYEVKRYKKLLPILHTLDLAIDIHSTTQEHQSIMGITAQDYLFQAKQFFDTQAIVVDKNINKIGAFINPILQNNKPAFGIECGSHNDTQAYYTAICNIFRMVNYFFPDHLSDTTLEKNICKRYQNIGSFSFMYEVIPDSYDFFFSKEYKNFDPIFSGEIYAKDKSRVYRNETDEILYIGLIGKNIKPNDGICFLFQKC